MGARNLQNFAARSYRFAAGTQVFHPVHGSLLGRSVLPALRTHRQSIAARKSLN